MAEIPLLADALIVPLENRAYRSGVLEGARMLFVKRTLFLILFALLLCPVTPRAQSLGFADPESVGFSRERLDRIATTINADVAAGIIPARHC